VADPEVCAVVRGCVREVLGPGARRLRLQTLAADAGRAVMRVTVDGVADPLVVKVARAGSARERAADFQRTAAAVALATAAGVPTAEVLAAHTAGPGEAFGWLVQRSVEGVVWRRLRPTLDDDQVRPVHRQLADAVLALRTSRPPAFGELDAAGRPAGDPLVPALLPALLRRADLLVRDAARRAVFHALLEREAALFDDDRPGLCHDDLHHDNVVLSPVRSGWRIAAVLDWDKAWAGPAESDVARMAFWDGMTGPGFWEVYRAAVPESERERRRALVHQLLWCLEYDVPTARHRADTAAVASALGIAPGGAWH
jgi:aminoglycoside phosphotransferase (APT) family kinase protein